MRFPPIPSLGAAWRAIETVSFASSDLNFACVRSYFCRVWGIAQGAFTPMCLNVRFCSHIFWSHQLTEMVKMPNKKEVSFGDWTRTSKPNGFQVHRLNHSTIRVCRDVQVRIAVKRWQIVRTLASKYTTDVSTWQPQKGDATAGNWTRIDSIGSMVVLLMSETNWTSVDTKSQIIEQRTWPFWFLRESRCVWVLFIIGRGGHARIDCLLLMERIGCIAESVKSR